METKAPSHSAAFAAGLPPEPWKSEKAAVWFTYTPPVRLSESCADSSRQISSTARSVSAEVGVDPNVVTLAAEEPGDAIAATLATDPRVRVIDFTGSSEFGNWLEHNARQAVVYTEKSGLNTVIVDSTDDYKGMLRNLSFSLSLYSCLLYTSPSPRDLSTSRMPSSA